MEKGKDGDLIMGKRIHNFNAGPAALPLPVLEEIREEFLDYKGYCKRFRVVSTAFSPPGFFVHIARYRHEIVKEFL